MKILYIAYSCDPYNGSEDKIGWNVALECSKMGNEVFVITKEEQRKNVEKYCNDYKLDKIHFFYVDIENVYKRIFDGMLYSGRIQIWNKKVYKLAKRICYENHIDIIHQITPIEFRSIGSYGNIKNTKFVVGPIGGAICIPKQLTYYSYGHRLIELFRRMVNRFYYYKLLINKNLKKCDFIYCSNFETKDYLNIKERFDIMTDLGSDNKNILCNKKNVNKKLVFIIAGRLIYIKGHKLLFDAVKKFKNYNYDFELRIIGDGPMKKELFQIVNNDDFLRQYVKFVGKVKYEDMVTEYENCDVFIFTSIRDNTGSVILESMENGCPVICMNAFGGRLLVNEENGYLFEGKNKEEIVNSLFDAMKFFLDNPTEIKQRGKKAFEDSKKYCWKNKVKQFNEKYMDIIEK